MTCPSDKPFKVKSGTHSFCVKSCGPRLVADGKNCIKVEDCKKPVLSDGKCMELCEDGYLYVTFDYDLSFPCYGDCSYTTDNIKQKLCEKESDIILKIVAYVFGIVLYIVFLFMFFSTRPFPCCLLVSITLVSF